MKQPPTFEEITTFVVAMTILVGSFLGLLVIGGSNEVRIVYGSLIGGVMTYFFQRAATKAATSHTIEAQNNGLDAIRQTVTRIEDGRAPTAEDLAKRNHRSGPSG